jgi:3-hydroxyisobutyrate dehydrogenase
MVENLRRQGDSVVCWNRTLETARKLEKIGATTADTAAAAVVDAERVHMALFDDASVDSVLAQIVPKLAPGAVVIDHTTTGPLPTSERAKRLADAGVSFLHAPLFMNPKMCSQGDGIMLVSGPTEVFESVRGALDKLANRVWYRGPRADLAAVLKLLGNALLFALSGAVADVLALAQGAGVAPLDAMSILTTLEVQRVVQFRGEKMMRSDFSTTFDLQTVRKDLGLMLAMADPSTLLLMPHLALPMDKAIAAGYGEMDMAAIVATATAPAKDTGEKKA